MTTCPHLTSASLHPPRPSDSVYREDCTLCFDSIDSPSGLSVCLHCFNGGCTDDRNHARLHATQAQHPLAVNIKRTRKRKHRDEPPQKLSKLAISAETEEDRYETETDLRCLECGVEGLKREGKVEEVVEGVLRANTFSKQEEVKAWELELTPCEHTLCLEQEASRQIGSGDLGHCGECELKENLWLCLTCGNLGCGRKQMGGVTGNNHQVEHNQKTGHPVAVKLGSITAEGNADIYCYACDEERTDSELVLHLSHWGIDIAGREKTEKSLQELNVEQNMSWDFSMTNADGKELKAMFGPGFTGLKNLGNSCYLNSVLQSLFSMPEFAKRYYRPDEDVPATGKPAEDLEIQLRKVADGLLSGRYSVPDTDVATSEDTPEQPHQRGLAPAMLKYLIGRGHEEFSTMRQQDSFELLLHLLKLITRSQQSAKSQYKDTSDPVDAFRFTMEQKLQCLSCKKVRYSQDSMENLSVAVPIRRVPKADSDITMSDTTDSAKPKDDFEPVTLEECLSTYTAQDTVELTCPSCSSKDGFSKQTRFLTFPTILAINARRFEIVNWVPTKQDVPVIVSKNALDLESFRVPPHDASEELLPENAAPGKAAFAPNQGALDSLLAMGFPQPRCERALHATGNSDAETAMSWLFEHMEDPDIDVPLDLGGGAGGAANAAVDDEKIESLGAMGFSAPQARQALRETGGDMERAVDWLFSHPDATGEFASDAPLAEASTTDTPATPVSDTAPAKYGLKSIVCHKGSSIHAGHYVAFVRKDVTEAKGGEEEWVLFNDEKVAKGRDGDELQKFAYVYFFHREGV
ncbi:ubiquitin C-terminal hydrolase Ubp14 [Oleoguttula sp. CCFEE 5521]